MMRFSHITTTVTVIVLAMALLIGYQLMRSQAEAEVYRERLQTLSKDYEQLRSLFNEAVKRTAVTELIVKDGRLSVAIRTIQGDDLVIPTPYDPKEEIYIDYVVLNGRLWIRRVFDAKTAPEKGCVIDPQLANVDWSKDDAAHGKAVYRKLTEGRWIVTVTGDGSLGLAKRDTDEPTPLAPPPDIKDYSRVMQDAKATVEKITPGDVLKQLMSAAE